MFEYNSEEYNNEIEKDSDTSVEFENFLDDKTEKQANEVDAWDKYKDKDIPLGDASKWISGMD